MPALIKTKFTGEIVWLGVNDDREVSLRGRAIEQMDLSFAGNTGESHSGLTRNSCSRVLAQYPRDTEIRNTRQLSIVSQEELEKIASVMGIDEFDPAWVGASMVIKGIPDFTLVPPNSRLQSPSGATLTIDMENRPCVLPAKVINQDMPSMGPKFKPAAQNLRGVTAWVEREGILRVGDEIILHVPDQPVWPHLAIARGQ